MNHLQRRDALLGGGAAAGTLLMRRFALAAQAGEQVIPWAEPRVLRVRRTATAASPATRPLRPRAAEPVAPSAAQSLAERLAQFGPATDLATDAMQGELSPSLLWLYQLLRGDVAQHREGAGGGGAIDHESPVCLLPSLTQDRRGQGCHNGTARLR